MTEPPSDDGFGAAARRHDRRLRRRGLAWLWFGFAVCPCHLPFTLLAVGALFGGTAIGAAITGNPLPVGVVLGTITVIAYVKGLRMVRAADACSAGSCGTTAGTTTDTTAGSTTAGSTTADTTSDREAATLSR